MDALERPFLDVRVLGRDGGALSFSRRAEAALQEKAFGVYRQRILARRRPISAASPTISPRRSLAGRKSNPPISKAGRGSTCSPATRSAASASPRIRGRGGSTCSTISNTTRRRWRMNIFATSRPASRSNCRSTYFPGDDPSRRRPTLGARTAICAVELDQPDVPDDAVRAGADWREAVNISRAVC